MTTNVLAPGWVARAEAARHLRMTPEALSQADHRGKGPGCTKLAGRAYYRVIDLDHWKANR